MTNNQYNFNVDRGLVNDVDVSNTVDGKPIYYWVNKQEMAVPLDAGCVVLVNCARITVQDLNLTNNWAGVLLGWAENSTITKNKIANNYYGIYLSYSSNNSLFGNNITKNWGGINLWNSKYNSLNRNNITNNDSGIGLSGESHWYGSSNNNIYGNTITNNSYHGVALWGYSNNNAINGNTITNNSYGITVGGSSNIISENMINDNKYNLDVSGDLPSHSIDASNLVDGEPVYYLKNNKDLVINPSTHPRVGYLALINCVNITVEGLNLENNGQGLLIYNTNDSKITENTITNNDGGIYLAESSKNNILRNSIAKNRYGIFLDKSTNNCIFKNNITENENGIILAGSSNNVIYHNNFVDNTSQTYIWPSIKEDGRVIYEVSINAWDDGYPSGGNYWSDYTGEDANGDGIGDTPYVINEDNIDRYPLMNLWAPPEHELVTSISAPLSLWLGTSSLLDAIVTNDGLNDEGNVELRLLINGTVVNSTTIPLLKAGNSYTLSYQWTPTIEGTYNVTAYAHPVPGESYVENNQMSTFVTVAVPPPELVVSIMAPTSLQLGNSLLLDANVTNLGLNDAINVELLLLINGTIMNSTTISLLQAGDTYTLSYLWTPTAKGTYNVTAYASPVPGESYVENNQMIKFVTVVQVGVRAGDWIKCTYTISGWPSGTPYPEWLKVEFLSVEGANATTRVTMRMSDGTEPSQTMTIDVVAGGGTFQGLSGFVIPANCTTGDSIYITGYGAVTISGETTRTYAGASRTVVYTSFSQYGTQLTYYWDKLTGVMVEASVVSGTMTGTAKVTETNIWQAAPSGLPIEPTYLILAALLIIIAVGATAFIMRRKKKPPEEVENSQSKLRLTRAGFKRNFGHRITRV